MPIRFRYLFKCFLELVKVISHSFKKKQPNGNFNTLLIIKTDAIGDYILFRNFLQEIRNSKTFDGYKIVFCGNEIYKDLAQIIDANVVDEFIWINRKQFVSDSSYRSKFLKQMALMEFHTVINAIYSREFLVDDLITFYAKATYKIGHQGNDSNDYKILKLISNNWYTQLINSESDSIFEFSRNKKFVETITSSQLQTKLALPLPNNPIKAQTIILFPGAGEKQKQWSPKYFAQTVNAVHTRMKFEFIICGGAEDIQLGDSIISQCNPTVTIKNGCGQTSLLQLSELIQNAQLLISNDSSAVHIAACVNTSTICLANGRHFGRFLPYPSQISRKILCLFPPETQKLAEKNRKKLEQQTKLKALEDIHKISPELVIEKAIHLLPNAYPTH